MKKLLFAFVTLSLMLVSCGNSDVNSNLGVDEIEEYEKTLFSSDLEESAKSGDVKAMCGLGYSYEKGNGVEKNDYKAVEWFGKAADQGQYLAMLKLAKCYKDGRGVSKNMDEAKKWYDKATADVKDNIKKLFDEIYNGSVTVSGNKPAPTGDVNIEMVHVNGGEFRMGGTDEQGDSPFYDEFPIRDVYLNEFYIGKYEVTQGQWEAVMGNNPSKFKRGSNYPVENVTWYDAQSFCRQLSKMTGKTYRLPTEAEWEYAARGGDTPDRTKYSGNDKVNSVAWHKGNSGGTSQPVGMLQPNGLGIYDMSGNIWEWVSDWWSKAYDPTDTDNPKGASTGSKKVVRGGSWYFKSSGCRISSRSVKSPNDACSYRGFRVVMEP